MGKVENDQFFLHSIKLPSHDAAMATTTPDKTGKSLFFFIALQSRGLDHVAKGTELPDRRKKKDEKVIALRFDRIPVAL